MQEKWYLSLPVLLGALCEEQQWELYSTWEKFWQPLQANQTYFNV